MDNVYDVIIIGAGPAGLSAGLYAGRSLLKTLIIEKITEGGQIVSSSIIENYPGSIEDESGFSLIERMVNQVKSFNTEIVKDNIIEIDLSSNIKKIKCLKETYYAESIILALGASPRKIGCKGEEDYIGKGVSFCATCDGAFFRGLDIYVIGGGDSAVEEALFLTKFGKKVTIVHRRDTLRATKNLQRRAFNHEKIDFIWDSVVEEVKGDGLEANGLVLRNIKTGELTEIKASEEDKAIGIFVFIGLDPNTGILEDKIDMKNGYVIGDEDMKTNIEGVFVAGDCKYKSIRQVVTAVSDGAIAAINAEKFLDTKKE